MLARIHFCKNTGCSISVAVSWLFLKVNNSVLLTQDTIEIFLLVLACHRFSSFLFPLSFSLFFCGRVHLVEH